ncbi:MAG: TetR/AcrR family transcriptional regulator [Acidimicrobiales bacterium]
MSADLTSTQPALRATGSGVQRPWRGVSAQDRVAMRRRRLLDAGLDLFGTRGVAAVTVADVCAAAGLTKRYFYESFPSIVQLLDAVVEEALDRITAMVLPVLVRSGPLDPRPALSALAQAVLADPRLVRLLVAETRSGALLRYRELLIARAVETWMAAFGIRDDQGVERRRVVAYACAGAVSEVAVAYIEGRVSVELEELVDWVLDLYERVVVPTFGSATPAADPDPT